MTRNKPPVIALAIAGLGLVAILGTVFLMRSATTSPPPSATEGQAAPTPTPEPPKTKQYVATQFIAPRTLITQAMLREDETATPTGGAITDRTEVLGQLASGPIFAGRPILASQVTEPLQRAIKANFEVPNGLVAVAIFVDPNSTAAGLVDIGDRVDVILTSKITMDPQDTESTQQLVDGSKSPVIGRTIAQDLLVLAVDKSIDAPPPTPTPNPTQAGALQPGGAAPAATPTPPPPPPANNATKARVILAATPQVAAHLVAANETGNLHVTIRNPNSREQQSIGTVYELPSRYKNVPKQSFIDARREKAVALAKQLADMRRADTMPQPIIKPMPPGGGIISTIPSAPAAAPTPNAQDVTVIRGTEKTLVTVPKK